MIFETFFYKFTQKITHFLKNIKNTYSHFQKPSFGKNKLYPNKTMFFLSKLNFKIFF